MPTAVLGIEHVTILTSAYRQYNATALDFQARTGFIKIENDSRGDIHVQLVRDFQVQEHIITRDLLEVAGSDSLIDLINRDLREDRKLSYFRIPNNNTGFNVIGIFDNKALVLRHKKAKVNIIICESRDYRICVEAHEQSTKRVFFQMAA